MSINVFPMFPALVRALQDEGLLPEECGNLRVEFPVDGVVQMHYTVNLDLKAFTRALTKALIETGNDPFAEDP